MSLYIDASAISAHAEENKDMERDQVGNEDISTPSRNHVAGSYDNEAIAIFLLVFTFYLWIKAVKNGSIMWGLDPKIECKH
jgi:hypothetical protein